MGEDGAALFGEDDGTRPHPRGNRLFVESVLLIARTPWCDLPPGFGKWTSVFTRFRDRVKADVSKQLFDAVSDETDMEYAMVDATIVKVHRHGQGAKGGSKPGHRQAQGGMTTNVLALTDSLGNLVSFVLLPGNASTPLASHR